ncbi:MAG: hypothetical protein ACRCYO_12935, partial [Bacteroidia bacterium]
MKKMVFALLLVSASAYAQKKKCPIYGTAYTDCATGITQLNASGGFTDYSWSPAAPLSDPTIPNPTTTTPGVYTVTGYVLGGEMVTNPDLSAGNTGFFSGMNYAGVYNPGNYFVGGGWFSTPINPSFPDHTPTSDNMFMSLDGASPATVIWEHNFTTAMNTNYAFSFWGSRADFITPQYEIHFIDISTATDVIVANQTGILYNPMVGWKWDKYGVLSWNSGATSNLTIRIINTQTNPNGNDFGMDDFSFRQILCSGSYTVNATVSLGMDLFTNGDFSLGNTGFISGQTYAPVYTPCNYYVGPGWFSSTYNAAYPDHTGTSDNMFMSVDGCSPATVLWEQTIPVTSSTIYNFEFWATDAHFVQPIYEIHFIGDVTGDVIVSTQAGLVYNPMLGWNWNAYGVPCWNSEDNSTVTVRVINLETNPNGNDFGMDDFSFRQCCIPDQCCSTIPHGRLAGNSTVEHPAITTDV